MIDTLPVLIGYDPREDAAADVCRHSLLKRSSIPLYVRYLRQEPLRHAGLYRRQWEYRNGQRVDLIDELPFSTEFSFTRFLVPALMQYEGWALFVDCDFLFVADIVELLPHLDDSKAVMVCKQVHVPKEDVKMDGVVQTKYERKNWSSFMLFNCSHPSVRNLSVRAVNENPGFWLHKFRWLEDSEIGDLPHAWNWIDGVTEGTPKAIHYTTGGPWFKTHQSIAYADEWRSAYSALLRKGRVAA